MTIMWSCIIMNFCFYTDILKFDNSYSWARSKEIFYSVKISAPSVCMEPRPSPVVQQQKEAGSPQPHWSMHTAPSSSEDEFFDCLQELEITQETILPCDQCSTDSLPNQSRTVTTHRQIITGTSVSTQVWVSLCINVWIINYCLLYQLKERMRLLNEAFLSWVGVSC